MEIDFEPFFSKYEALVKQTDEAFKRVETENSDCVKCEIGCSDCCHALFDITLIEAIYINRKFGETHDAEKKADLIEKANKADRETYKIKKKAYKDLEAGKDEESILSEMAEKRVRCPLLNEQEKCDLYDYRPITCRLYGIPTLIGDKAHSCGKSAFLEGKDYPTANLNIISDRLYAISNEFVKAIKSKHIKMGDIIVPLSMALLTVYDDDYLGISNKSQESE